MSFLKHFEKLDDPRSHVNRKHNLLDIMFLTVSAMMSGAEGWKDIKEFGDAKLEWLRQFREFEHGIPVDDTIARVISSLKPAQFLSCFMNWVNEMRELQGNDHLAIDGKTLRRSFKKGQRKDALHMLSVWASKSELFFSGARSEGKKNEVQTILELLELLEIKGQVITIDAMGCQRAIAAKIQEKQGDYLLALKGNQGNLHKEVQAYFHKCHRDKDISDEHRYSEIDKGHGRVEERHCVQIPITNWVSEAAKWQGAKSVIEITRIRHIDDKTSTETQYYLSSLEMDVKASAGYVRKHWGVENKVHWVLDMSFREDESRIRRGDGAEIMSMIRRFCMNLARLNTTKNSIKGKLKNAGWNDKFREELLFA